MTKLPNNERRIMSFGTWLRRRRKLQGMTQEELGARIGCSADTIRKVELGSRHLSKQLAYLLAEFLGVNPEEYLLFLRYIRADTFELAMPPDDFDPESPWQCMRMSWDK